MALATAVFFLLSHFSVLRGDDKLFSLLPAHDYAPIRSWFQYLLALKEHYVANNGRTSDLILMFFLAFCSKSVWDVANTAVFVLFLAMLRRLAGGGAAVVAIAVLYVLLLFPIPGETMMWMAGSCNYLWSISFTLVVVDLLSRSKQFGWVARLLALCACFVAGSMNESVSVSFLAGAAIWYVSCWRERGRFALWMIAAYLAGFAVILASPGLWARLGGGQDIDLNAGVGQMIVQRLLIVLTKSVQMVVPLIAAILLVFEMRISGVRRSLGNILNSMWLGALFAVLLFGLFKDRVYSFYSVTSFLLVMRWLAESLRQRQRLAVVVAISAVILSVWPAVRAFAAISDYRDFTMSVERDVVASPDGVVPALSYPASHRFVAKSNYDSDIMCLYQDVYSAYYRKPNVQFLSHGLLRSYRQGNLEQDAKLLRFRSSDESVARQVMALPDSLHAIIPVDRSRVKVMDETTVLTRNSRPSPEPQGFMAWAKQWYFSSLGVTDSVKTCGVYYLDLDSVRYLILPSIDPEVRKISIPIRIDDIPTRLEFTRP